MLLLNVFSHKINTTHVRGKNKLMSDRKNNTEISKNQHLTKDRRKGYKNADR